MQHRFPVEIPLLLDRVQVTHCSLRQANHPPEPLQAGH